MNNVLRTILVLLMAASVQAGTIARFGIITDIHHTNKNDSASRKYSAALGKTQFFVDVMNQENADFIIELGDLLDMLAGDKAPLTNFMEVENIYTSFEGPQYHVLGNHEFDNITRDVLLPNLDNTGIVAGKTYYSYDVNGIHCIVLEGNVGISQNWPNVSPTNGMDASLDCPFTLVEIEEVDNFDGKKRYELTLTGHAQQMSYKDLAQINE